MKISCPQCNGIIISEDGHFHCLSCARDYRLSPFRSERKRLELLKLSQGSEYAMKGLFSASRYNGDAEWMPGRLRR